MEQVSGTLICYIAALVRVKRIFKTGGDMGHMGGDYIIDGRGRIAGVVGGGRLSARKWFFRFRTAIRY
ncbi:MAG: hypothetical protein JW984_06045 [Deltaproteobacteria bacterium]|uniref:Uncharacterized protein n=1 Tax=Candidatus Zymogenus saltonus TaxID=2844893 RepID=A0A9D8KEZ1_9DELT|nr:hypothetical protein [Candidatus Zymogenus saltonus]